MAALIACFDTFFYRFCLKGLGLFAILRLMRDTNSTVGALKHLVDIRYSFLESNPGFKLEFEFEENDYFTNTVLTKSYFLTEADHAVDLLYDHATGYRNNLILDLKLNGNRI